MTIYQVPARRVFLGHVFPNLEGQACTFSHCANWRRETSRLSAPDGMAQSSCLSQFETAYSGQCLVFHFHGTFHPRLPVFRKVLIFQAFLGTLSSAYIKSMLVFVVIVVLCLAADDDEINEAQIQLRSQTFLSMSLLRTAERPLSPMKMRSKIHEVEKVQRLIDAGFSPSTYLLWPVGAFRPRKT